MRFNILKNFQCSFRLSGRRALQVGFSISTPPRIGSFLQKSLYSNSLSCKPYLPPPTTLTVRRKPYLRRPLPPSIPTSCIFPLLVLLLPLPFLPFMENPYCLGRQLGTGIDGVVRVCTDNSSGLQYACKTVIKSNPDALLHFRTEIAVLEKLRGHPNIVSLYGHFEDEESVHLVMDLCEGGDLCEHLQQKGPLSEHEAAQAMATILRALSFCHERGVMHRDLKPENILFPRRNSPYSELKLADFGAAADFSRRRVFSDIEGTPWYLAPEVLTGSYDEKVDVWSLGVLLHIMLCGYLPFDGEAPTDIFQSIKRGRLDLKREPWSSISAGAKELVKGMLQKNPYRRMRLRELLVHPWVQNSAAEGGEKWGDLQTSESVTVGG